MHLYLGNPFAPEAAGFRRRIVRCSRFSVMAHEIEAGRSAGEHRHAELFPIGTYVPPWRPVATARQRSSLREFPAGNSAKSSADLHSKQQPTISAVNHYCVSAQPHLRTSSSKKDAGRVENRHALAPSARLRPPSTARIDGHSRIGVRLSCGNFSNLRVFE
ncbi:hypothetical protein CN220_06585 [Sinorhizobium meliloti]|nr:hypothetical protein CN220_06585 [Sinorhizobium meliloti]